MKRKIIFVSIIIALIGLVFYLTMIHRKSIDTILINSVLHTLTGAHFDDDAIAISDGIIIDIGKSSDLLEKYSPKKIIDLQGANVYPGFIDSHAHMYGLGMLLSSINLSGLKSSEEIVKLVAEEVKKQKPGEWIYGRGWDQTLWQNKEFPYKNLLDSVSPNNPVILGRIDGHAIWVNQRALELAAIDKNTPDPEGGKIIRDNNGNPTGVLIDKATELIEKIIPPPTDAEIENYLIKAIDECVKYGITEVHDMGLDKQLIRVYEKLIKDKKLLIRIYGAIDAPGEDWEEVAQNPKQVDFPGDMLKVKAVKMYADGALGSRGAALIEEYSDDPGNRGLTLLSDSIMEGVAQSAINNGFQICVHAIGDRANHIVLNLFEKIIARYGESDYRFRIEHAQVIAPEDIPRFAKLRVIPSMQPVHCVSDMDWAEERLGKIRIKGAYAWRSLLDNGSIIAAGSDSPNDILDPIVGFYSAITRSDPSKSDIKSWYPEQCMNREEALRAYTIWAAYSAFREKKKGTIEIGKYADFTILSKNILEIPENEILSTEVLFTIVDGRVVYNKN
ncbi:MAG: Exoenzymes regulatory protein AepA precursor [Ignavibacteriae bacterium]|nr:MAG: Exoenzymes regulatory protein AepA precursor [Ignavibacteriota bacterium]